MSRFERPRFCRRWYAPALRCAVEIIVRGWKFQNSMTRSVPRSICILTCEGRPNTELGVSHDPKYECETANDHTIALLCIPPKEEIVTNCD